MEQQASDRFAFPLLIAVLLVAFVCGGGGIEAAFGNLAVQLVALMVLAVRRESVLCFWRESPFVLRLLIAASLALPLVQIIPLPPAIWTMLPGRSLVFQALEQTGQADAWMPISLDPLRTLLALTALVTPLAVLTAGWTLPRTRLIELGWITVALGVVTLVIGAVQISSPTDQFTIYGSRDPGAFLVGTFASRNSAGLFLTFTLALAALLPSPRPHPAVLPIRLGLCVLILVAIVLTQSRTALVIALLPALLGAMRAVAAQARGLASPIARTLVVAVGTVGLVGVGAGALVVTAPGRVAATLERFEAKDDARRFIWGDAIYSAGKYWPAGTGMGTFDDVYQVDESLENLTLRRAGRAHNDYIEVTIEAGAPGLALAALWLLLIGWLSWCARGSNDRWIAWAGSAFLIGIALQSITDYPLRMQTVLAFAGLALLLLTRIAARGQRSTE